MSESENLSGISQKLEELAPPRSYFRGAEIGQVELPQNVIVFQRKSAQEISVDPHLHYRFVLVVNLNGSGSIDLNHRVLKILQGQALLIFPNQFHQYREIQEGSIHWLFITFELPNTESLKPLRDRVTTLSQVAIFNLGQLVEVFKSWQQGRKKTVPALGLLTALTLQSLWEQESEVLPATTSSLPSVVERVSLYVLENYGKELTLDTLAYQFHLSGSHLRLLFRKYMHQSLGDFVRSVRLTRAQSFLVGTDKNVTQISQDCGYESIISFCRAFKKETGLSPLAYRKLNAAKF